MARTGEVVFIDPFVADLDTILGALRPEVDAVVLDDARPAARQIAARSRADTVFPPSMSWPTARPAG
jgi:hypothetical protein